MSFFLLFCSPIGAGALHPPTLDRFSIFRGVCFSIRGTPIWFDIFLLIRENVLLCAHSKKVRLVCRRNKSKERRGQKQKLGDVMPEQCSRCSASRLIHHRGPSLDSSNSKRRPPSFFSIILSALSVFSLFVYSLYSSPFFLSLLLFLLLLFSSINIELHLDWREYLILIDLYLTLLVTFCLIVLMSLSFWPIARII